VNRAPYFILVLALIGIAVALYDSYAIYNRQPLWCPPPIDGCNIVADSPYARIFGLRLGYFGLVYCLYMLGLVTLLAFDPFARPALGHAALFCLRYWLRVHPVHLHPRLLHLLPDLRCHDAAVFHRRTLALRCDARAGSIGRGVNGASASRKPRSFVGRIVQSDEAQSSILVRRALL
jgi:Vitamin K epoxide reductase family